MNVLSVATADTSATFPQAKGKPKTKRRRNKCCFDISSLKKKKNNNNNSTGDLVIRAGGLNVGMTSSAMEIIQPCNNNKNEKKNEKADKNVF